PTASPSCCSRSKPSKFCAASTARVASAECSANSLRSSVRRRAVSTRWPASRTASSAASSRKPIGRSRSGRRIGFGRFSKSIPMRPVRTVTSSALRSIPAWPPASAVSSIAFRCSPWPKRACSRLAPNAGRVASTHNFLLRSRGRAGWGRLRNQAAARSRAELLSSRLSATAALVQALGRTPADRRPPVFVSASGIDFYGDRGEEVITEESHPGDSFLARLSQQWEAEAQKAEPLGVRVARIRTAMVFGREALAFRLLTLPFRFFLGGPLGNGRQWFTWIHLEDIVGLYRL